MKFEFKGVSYFEENATPSFAGVVVPPTVIKEFNTMDEAIEYVDVHHGFATTEDEKLAFLVRKITQVK